MYSMYSVILQEIARDIFCLTNALVLTDAMCFYRCRHAHSYVGCQVATPNKALESRGQRPQVEDAEIGRRPFGRVSCHTQQAALPITDH